MPLSSPGLAPLRPARPPSFLPLSPSLPHDRLHGLLTLSRAPLFVFCILYLFSGKKKKWSKGKTKEKVNNEVMYTQAAYDKMLVEVPKMKMITPSILSDRLRINGSLARATLKHLEAEGKIRAITKHSAQLIYTRATNVAVE